MFFPLILDFPISALKHVFVCIWAVRNSLMKNAAKGTSLVVQLLRLCTPMQGSQVQSLVRELDSTCSS